MKKFLIIGTGHSGTTYMSNLLNAADVPTGRSTVYNSEGYRGWPELIDGDVGWEWVPYLEKHDGPIVHIVRDPRKFFGTCMNKEYPIHGREWGRLVNDLDPEILKTTDKLEQAIRFWRVCIRECEKYADDTQRIENLDLDRLLKVIGHPRPPDVVAHAMEIIPTNTSATGLPPIIFQWSDLPDDIYEKAREFGYS